MARSISHAVYRAISRRKSLPAATGAVRERPPGELVWAHASSPLRYSALCDLGQRLMALRPGVNMLITADHERFSGRFAPREGCFRCEYLASDDPAAAKAFISHWKPDICLWTGGDLMPNLIAEAAERHIPMVLLDVDETEWGSRVHKWFPAILRETLECFDKVMVNGTKAQQLARNTGLRAEKIILSNRLSNSVTPPPCSESLLSRVTGSLSSRPVWLAAHARPEEFDAILEAHNAAQRLLHRLLLVITVAEPADADALRQALERSRMRYVDWAAGDSFQDYTQVIMDESEDDLGLWYRLAPLTFMASSLFPGLRGRNPLEPAALGSAIVSGPYMGEYGEIYARLTAAGATRTVHDGRDLGAAVTQLIAPDNAAAMALAGWESVTENAQTTDLLIDLVQDLLDQREATHAGT